MDFTQIAILLAVAGVSGIFARLLKQPLIIGYLIAGLVLGFSGVVTDTTSLESLGQVGVALLLFLLGLEMNMGELPSIGKVAVLTGIGQIIFTSGIGFLLATVLGFETLPAIYIAVALTFSSTIIMVKLLSEKKDLSSLYGKIAVGFLLVQDLVAVLILMFLSGMSSDNFSTYDYAIIGVKALVLIVSIWVLSKKVFPQVFDRIVSHSNELLFIVSIAWALGLAAFVDGPLGFTMEIGGFLAGLALSNLPEHLQIASKTRPLRDFFLTIFFLLLGTQLVVGEGILPVLIPAMIMSVFVLVGNPIIVLTIMGLLGYRKRTSFMAGLTVAQISEFSLILIAMGASLGHLQKTHLTLVILVGIITMTVSTYMILGADKLYAVLKKYLTIFEKKHPKEISYIKKSDLKEHVVLVGCDRTGRELIPFFKRRDVPFVVIDFNPSVIVSLTAEKVHVIFGDANDPEILEAAQVEKSRMVISTIANYSDNLTLLEYVRGLRTRPRTIFTSQRRSEALRLYEAGANYLIVPEVVAGEHIKHLLSIYGLKGKRLTKAGKSHFRRLIFS